METTQNTENSGNNNNGEEVKRVMKNAVRSSITLGNIKIARKFYAVDEEKNTDPAARDFERIELTIREKIGSKFWIIEGDINSDNSEAIGSSVFVGYEETEYNRETEKDQPVPFSLNMRAPHVLVSYERITLYRSSTFLDQSNEISVYALARLFDLKISTAQKLMDAVKKFYEFGNKAHWINGREA
jgi:hypothetical protein